MLHPILERGPRLLLALALILALVAPPALANALPTADKVFHAMPGLSHEPAVASDRLAWRFLERRLGLVR